jgi:hypothetical protein
MGFTSKSGSSAVALGALRQFGLVDGLRGSVRVSDLALRILEPSSLQEEAEAKREAAFKPDIYEKLLQHFGGELPRSDEPIRAYLIRTLAFSKVGADECMAVLRRTMAELSVTEFAHALEVPPREEASPQDTVPLANPVEPPKGGQPEAVYVPVSELIRIPLTKDCTAELRLIGEITPAAIQRLVQYIELMTDVWAAE